MIVFFIVNKFKDIIIYYYGVALKTKGLWMMAMDYNKNIERRAAPKQEFKITSIPPTSSTTPVAIMIYFEYYLMKSGCYKYYNRLLLLLFQVVCSMSKRRIELQQPCVPLHTFR